MFEQLPPHDTQAEESVIASLMVDPDAIVKVAPLLQPDDFFRDSNRWAYEVARDLWERNQVINQVTVAHELDRRNKLEEVGGLAYLSELVLNLPTPIGVEHYAEIVAKDAVYRRMISAAMSMAQIAYRADADLDAALARAEQLVIDLRSNGGRPQDFRRLEEYLEEYLDAQLAPAAAPVPYQGRVFTGLMELDKILGGFAPADLFIVAARTGVGKTSLMLNFARNAAIGQQKKVAIFSLEMAGEELSQRMLAAEANVDSRQLRLGMLSPAVDARIMQAHGLLSQADIFIDDTAAIRIPDIRAKSMRLRREAGGLDMIIIDYLQLVHGNRSENRQQEVSFITRSLKELAKELDIPIIAGSQLSRATDQRAQHVPVLSDLRESGSIEQDADSVLFIYREDVYISRQEWEMTHPDRARDPYPEGKAQLILAKHRHGPTGVAEVRFRQAISKFEDYDMPAGALLPLE